MPRPFAVTGFVLFFVLFFLFTLGINAAWVLLALFAAGFAVFMCIGAVRSRRVLPIACAVGAVGCILFISTTHFEYYHALEYSGKTVSLKAEITDYAEFKNGRCYYEARTTEINGVRDRVNIRLSFKSALEAEPYDTVEGEFTVYTAGYSFEESESHYRAKNVFIGAYPASYTNGSVTAAPIDKSEKPLMYKALRAKSAVSSAVRRLLPNENGGLACALLLGDYSSLPKNTKRIFSDIGISHVICVSGMHLSVWTLGLYRLAEKLKLNRIAAGALSAVFILGFMLLTGFTYSVVRAGTMLLLCLLANMLSRQRDSLNSLGFAATLLLLIDPYAAGNLSFELSFLSTLGIVFCSTVVSGKINALAGKIKPRILQKALKYAVSILLMTTCAGLFTFPITLMRFGSVNLLVYLSNFSIIPAATLCMVTSGLAGAASFVPFIGLLKYPLGLVGGVAARYILFVCKKIHAIGFLTAFPDERLSLLWLGAALIIIAAAVLFARRGKKAVGLTVLLCCATFASMLAISAVFNADVTKIKVLDVGNASAVLVSKGRRAALIGCGKDDYFSSSKIIHAIDDAHIASLELLLVPRAAATEAACAVDVLKEHKTKSFAYSEMPEGVPLLLGDAAQAQIADGFEAVLWEGCTVRCVSNAEVSCAYITADGATVLVSFYPGGDFSESSSDFSGADILICRAAVPKSLDPSSFKAVIISGNTLSEKRQNRLLANGIECAATAGYGSITLKIDSEGSFGIYRE